MRSISQPARPRRFWRILPLILLPLMLALFGLIVWASLHGEAPRFDPAAWQAARTSDQLREDRYEVLDDLRQQYLRPGTPRQQVLEWLGAPDADGSMSYTLGHAGDFFQLDSYVLSIEFDDQDRLLQATMIEQ